MHAQLVILTKYPIFH